MNAIWIQKRNLSGQFFNQGSHGIDIIPQSLQAKTQGFEGNTSPTSCRVKTFCRSIYATALAFVVQPLLFCRRKGVRKSTAISIRIFYTDACPLCFLYLSLCFNRITMYAQRVQKAFPVGIHRQQGGQDSGPGSHQRTARPPDMQSVGGREGRHGRSFAHTFNTDLRNGEPFFDKTTGHGANLYSWGSVNNKRRAQSTRRGFFRCMAMPSQ